MGRRSRKWGHDERELSEEVTAIVIYRVGTKSELQEDSQNEKARNAVPKTDRTGRIKF